ncbi:hypothetical protein [Breznakia pachnodae]|uniref:Uncharacterized protein n=1 Tax=Breznakia pachnodae TaxID=265178 RepID=A0ABU0E1A2_9FIRM|nr:hypothetical protein [Breznakia pachnodae]MDQ0360611.1 hypothetical protein [Breznakia pachnodae]
MIFEIIKKDIILSMLCSRQTKLKNPEEYFDKSEKILFLIHIISIEEELPSFLKGKIWIDGNTIYIPYLSDLMRACPNFHIHYSGIDSSNVSMYLKDYNKLKKKPIEEIEYEVNQYIELYKDSEQFMFGECKHRKWYRKYARMIARKNDQSFRYAMKTVLISLPCILLPICTIMVVYITSRYPVYRNNFHFVFWLLGLEIIFALIWIMITLKQIKPTEFEKSNEIIKGDDKY